MQTLKNIFLLALVSTQLLSCKGENKTTETSEVVEHRVISLNSAITEILAALGQEDKIVGVDVTSTYPANIKEKAQDLGHVRSISLENVITLQPTLVLASDKDLNPELITKLQEANIKVKTIHQEQSIEGTKQFIKDIATAVGNTDYTSLIEKIDADFANLNEFEVTPKVLFIYARGAGTLMVAGKNTPMEKIITIAGGENAVNDFEDFKPLTPEALIQSNPDYILLFEKGLESLGGIDGVLQIQGISQINAGKNRQIITMDGALLSRSEERRVGKESRSLGAAND